MILYGGGGHASVVIDCLKSLNIPFKGVVDDMNLNQKFGEKYLGKYNTSQFLNEQFVICIGDNKIRQSISKKIKHDFGNAIHKLSFISDSAQIGHGNMIFQFAVVQANAQIANHCIVNTAAIVEHDCELGAYSHIATNAAMGGHASIGEGTLVGAGATILSKVKVGSWCVIGAGAVVTKDVPDFSMVIGVPGIIHPLN
jgi:acetyltransferase EpsM